MIIPADFMVLDKNFGNLATIDVFESIIWNERYYEAGDFEIYITPTEKNLKVFKIDNYIWKSDSEHIMVIDHIEITTDAEDGSHLIVKGHSLGYLIKRRIVWNTLNLDGHINEQFNIVFDQNIISPTNTNRKIDNFIFGGLITDLDITDLVIEGQFTGDNIYDMVCTTSKEKAIGWKITLDALNNFVFCFYTGKDRSYDQLENPYVVFSPTFDNIINSDYYESTKDFTNVALVAGEDQEGNKRKTLEVVSDEKYAIPSGLKRRELYVDARDIQSVDENGNSIPAAKYENLLKNKGKERLIENRVDKNFTGEMDTDQIYRYGEHFFLGDICMLENEFGLRTKVRVIEYIYSHDISGGIKSYPTFEVIDEGE